MTAAEPRPPVPVPDELRKGAVGPLLRSSLTGAAIGLVPMLGFYLAQRAGGTGWAVAVGVALTLAAFPFEHKATGNRRWAWIGLAGVALGAALALVTRDPKLFFLRVVIGDALWGLAMLGSLLIGKPLLGTFAAWIVPIPPEYKATAAYRRSFGLVTFVWGSVTLVRGGVRGWLLARGTLESFLGVQILTGWPVFAALLAFAIWYPRRTARRYVESLGLEASVIDGVLLAGDVRSTEPAAGRVASTDR